MIHQDCHGLFAFSMPGNKYASIKNPRMYRALRRQGYSKERAARIANSKEAGTSPGAPLNGPGGLMGNLGVARRKKEQSYSPPASARNNARRGLELRREYGRGGTAVGVARARDLANGKQLSRSTVARMASFNRHRDNALDGRKESDGGPSAAYIAWLLWGGTTGVDWAREITGAKKEAGIELNRRERRLLSRVASGKTPPRMGRLISLGLIREQGGGFALTPAGKLAATAKEGEKVEIVGNLCRVGGQFAPCDENAEEKPEEKPEQGGGASATPAAEPTPESERPTIDPNAPPPEGADATTDFLKGLGLDPKLSESLGEYIAAQKADPPEDVALNKDAAAALAAMGLIRIPPGQEGASNVTIELTSAGSNLSKSLDSADIAKAMSVVERGHNRAEERAKRDAERQARRAARQAEREARRAAREAARAQRRSGGRQAQPTEAITPDALSTKAMRPKRARAWKAAYAEARKQGMTPAAARKMASKVLRTADADKAAISYRKAMGRLSVFKDRRGQERWLSITTTAYQDQDKEWISRKAIRGAVALGDATGKRGPLRFWHVPGLDFGDCDYQATAQDGRVLIESGTFRSPQHAAVVKEAARRGYRMSPGFTHPAIEPVNGVYDHIAIFERSFLPPTRASNPYTALATTEERMLTPEKQKELETLVGKEKAAAFIGAVEATDKAAGERATYKESRVYLMPDGTPGVIADGVFVALKEATVKQEMTPEQMMQAGMTEMVDGEARAEDEGEEAEELEVMDMTASDLKMLIVNAVREVMGASPSEYAAKMAEMKAQYEEMGKAFTAMKEAGTNNGGKIAALEADLVALKAKLDDLQADAPAPAPIPVTDEVAAAIAQKSRAVTPPDITGASVVFPELFAAAPR